MSSFEDLYESPTYSNEDESSKYGTDYSDIMRTGIGSIIAGGDFLLSERKMRDPKTVSLIRISGILEGHEYQNFSKEQKLKVSELAKFIPDKEIAIYNVDILVPVFLYMAKYKNDLSKKNIKEFIKNANGLKYVNHLDFIRYLRMLS